MGVCKILLIWLCCVVFLSVGPERPDGAEGRPQERLDAAQVADGEHQAAVEERVTGGGGGGKTLRSQLRAARSGLVKSDFLSNH